MTAEHKRHHRPANPYCDGCMVGETKNKRKKGKTGHEHREPEKFGEISTCDHVYMRNWFGMPGVGGLTNALNFLDLGTGCKYSHAVENKDTLHGNCKWRIGTRCIEKEGRQLKIRLHNPKLHSASH